MADMVRALSCHKRLKTTPKSVRLLAGLLLLGPSASATPPAADPAYATPVVATRLAEPLNREASGLAFSRRTPGVLWTHNDSGGEPGLFALDAATGARRGKARVAGVANTDWEDLAAFTLDGRDYLLVADTGDNFAQRAVVVLHVVEEPAPEQLDPEVELLLLPAYSIPFVYEHGARDCESVAVDAATRTVWLLTKRDVPARVYSLPLAAATAAQPAVARQQGVVTHFRQPDALQRLVQAPLGALIGMPTAMDFTADGTAAVVVLYGDLLYFRRQGAESWAETLARKPVHLPYHQLPQAEAVAFSPDGRRIFVCSEIEDRLLRYDLP